jgi:hypothetical protein
MKENNFVGFIKTHKKEIAVATAATVVGVAAGVIGHKCYISKDYGKLLKLLREFGPNPVGASMTQSITQFLENATRSVQPLVPNVERTISGSLSGELASLFAENGINPDTTIISGILVGLKHAET